MDNDDFKDGTLTGANTSHLTNVMFVQPENQARIDLENRRPLLVNQRDLKIISDQQNKVRPYKTIKKGVPAVRKSFNIAPKTTKPMQVEQMMHSILRLDNELDFSVLNKGKSAIPPLFNGPEMLPFTSDKAKLFTENFSKNSNFDESPISLPVFPSRTNQKLHNISVTPKMVKKVITDHDLSKASGPDCIPFVVLKNCEPELSYILVELFNKCLKESCFPDCWKVSLVVPVFTNVGERSAAKNYHPVSLLSVVSKVFEKLVNNRIVDHLEKCGLFSDFQYGFRSSRSTADLLTVVSDRIVRAFKILPILRPCHTQCSLIAAINKRFSGSGLSEIWSQQNLSKVRSKESIFGELSEDFSLFIKLYNAG